MQTKGSRRPFGLFFFLFLLFSLILNALKPEQVGLKTPQAYTANIACTVYIVSTAHTVNTTYTI